MLAKFNPSGTHVHKGYLKVRIDLYPDVGDKTYPMHDVEVPVIPPEGYQGKVDAAGNPVDQTDYDNWIDGLPKIQQLNPALCAFIIVPETITKMELEDFSHQVFNKDTIKTLDDILIKPDSIHLVSPFMRGKLTLSDQKVQTKDIPDLIDSVNLRFDDLILPLEGGGKIISVEPQSIIIGEAAINRGSSWASLDTIVNKGQVATGSGSIDTVEWWFNNSGVNVQAGIFYLVSGTTYKSRAKEVIGSVAAGSKQTSSGLDMTVVAGDVVGAYYTGGSIERDFTGYSGVCKYDGEVIDPDDEAAYTCFANQAFSIYGTGEEPGGVDYPRSAAVIVGILPAQSRIFDATRITSVIIGNLVSFTKSWGRTETAAVIVGNLVSASRAVASTRIASVIVGNLVSFSKVFNHLRTAAVIIGNLVSQSRAVAYTRVASVIVGNLVSFIKSWNRTISAFVIIGNLVTASRAAGLTRLASVIIGVDVAEAHPLPGWGNRIQLTIDQNDIDGALTDFPVLVHLSTSSGINSADVSAVFDELGSDANRKKIAITTDDEVTECYVEIEKWDHASEEAWLWAKVPAVANGADTILYLYYDDSHADNTSYVGDTNSTPAENVWDANFKLVCHMRDNPDTSHVRDSTDNNNDGTKGSAGEPAEVDGQVGNAQDYNGVNGIIRDTNSSGFPTGNSRISAEVFLRPDRATGVTRGVILQTHQQGVNIGLLLERRSNGTLRGSFHDAAGSVLTSPSVATTGIYVVLAYTYDLTNVRLYVEGALVRGPTAYSSANLGAGRYDLGSYDPAVLPFLGPIDEARISDIDRSPDWLKATKESLWDDLLAFGSEDTGSPGASRIFDAIRTASVIVGNLVTASKVLGAIRTASVIVGVKVTASRVVAFTRSASVLIGNLVSATKSYGAIRAASVAIGIAVSASRTFGRVRTASVVIGVKVSFAYCALILTTLRLTASRLSIQGLTVSRMGITRLNASRQAISRRIRRCE